MYIHIQCSHCGKRRRISTKRKKYTENAIKQGWGSFGRALYCPECSKTWSERNDKPMAGNDNTFQAIVCIMIHQIEGR